MEIQVQTAERHTTSSRSMESDFDRYLDAIADAAGIFRSAVHSYLKSGPDGVCWQQAKRISERLRTLEYIQQKLETGVPGLALSAGLVAAMMDALAGVSRLLKDMKRQITGFAIESGFSGPGRHVPSYLVPDVKDLTEEVCAAVEALVEGRRPDTLWWENPLSGDDERSVGWYERRSDRLSMQLIKRIFSDATVSVEMKLALAQLVEEIDRVADNAEAIDRKLHASRLGSRPNSRLRNSH